jgi:excisionase family DNA binding protein
MSVPDFPMKPSSAPLMTVRDVATQLRCSTRTVYRLCDTGRMPPPVRLGSLVRWNRAIVEQWIEDGCPRIRVSRGGVS